MNKFIKENWFKITLLVILILTIGGTFYWNQYLPREIKRNCFIEAKNSKEQAVSADNNATMNGLAITRSDYEKIFKNDYETCLKRNGF